MRIAQVAPPWVSIPPIGYGGVERVVSELTEELVRRGHEVTLFASGDSRTSATLSAYYEKAVGNNGFLKGNAFTSLLHEHPAFVRAGEFDIIHSHDPMTLFFASLVNTPFVHTIHGTLVEGEVQTMKRKVYQEFKSLPFVSISDNQREGFPQLNYTATVYNGLTLSDFSMNDRKGTYLAWFGRITPKKGVVEAIRTAQQVHIPLKIAAAIDPVDQPFFDRFVKPLIDNTSVQFIGELNEKDRQTFLGGALALLFPIRWHEPFGLVMTETMACGTPVVATSFGSVPEIIADGITGFVVEGTPVATDATIDGWKEDAVGIANMENALQTLLALSDTDYTAMRRACRARVEKLFTVPVMVDAYEAVYKTLTGYS